MSKIEELDIKTLIDKGYRYDTSYQRNLAWTKKNSGLLIDSLMNEYYVPPILIANNEVVDGKQRILSLEKFINNEIQWIDSQNLGKKYFYDDLTTQQKAAWRMKTMSIIDLGEMPESEVLETFLRINNGSIKLNKAELKMAAALPPNRTFIKNLAKNENISKLTLTKRNDSRFKTEDLLIRCLAILTINKTQTKDVRKWSEKILLKDMSEDYNIDLNDYNDKFNETINLMYEILDSDVIPKKSFNTIFEAIFVSLFDRLDHKNALLFNKESVKKEIIQNISKIIDGQMGGGIKFDSMEYIEKRINNVNKIFDNYQKDYKRSFSYDQKLEMWHTSERFCNICNKPINSFKDFEADHIIPWTKGGKTSIENGQILCIECNRKKSKN